MRDYVAYSRRTGRTLPISKLPMESIHILIQKVTHGRGKGYHNPGVTREAYLDRLRLELLIRQLGLRD